MKFVNHMHVKEKSIERKIFFLTIQEFISIWKNVSGAIDIELCQSLERKLINHRKLNKNSAIKVHRSMQAINP